MLDCLKMIGVITCLLVGISACSFHDANDQLPSVPGLQPTFIRPNDVIGGGGRKKSLLSVRLGDVALPNGSNVAAINLGVDGIYVSDASGKVTTVTRYASPHVVNVVAYQGGSTTQIAQANVPTTTYASLTIVVDTASSNVIFGAYSSSASRPLFFEIGQRSLSSSKFGAQTTTSRYSPSAIAVTFQGPITLAANQPENIDVDFNAFESIAPTSLRTLSRPSLTVAAEGFEGMISGTVRNSSRLPVQQAVIVAVDSRGNVAGSVFTDSSGNFLMHTLAAGSYRLTVYNKYLTATGWFVGAKGASRSTLSFPGPSGVYVNAGKTTSAGTIAD